MAMPDFQLNPWNLNLIKDVEDIVVFLTRKSVYFCEFLFSKKCASHVRTDTANENKQFKETKTLISNSYLIRKGFQGYHCKSDIVICAWRVTWIYAYNSFKKIWKFLKLHFKSNQIHIRAFERIHIVYSRMQFIFWYGKSKSESEKTVNLKKVNLLKVEFRFSPITFQSTTD